MKRKHIALASLGLIMAITLPSCNTFAGMGRDIRGLGVGTENVAEGKDWQGNQRIPKPVLPQNPTYVAPIQ